MPHVSVVIPVFNSAPLIGAALDSVFAQTFTDYEVIVVDDGSEDQKELSAVLSRYAGRVQYVRQPNGGPAKARNTGVDRASGELVAFLDADDEWLPEKLARQVEYFREYPQTGLLHTALVGAAPSAAVSEEPPRPAFCDVFHTSVSINTLTVMMPRRVFKEVGGFDERREIHVEDWDLWLRVAADHPIGYIGTPLAWHRRGGFMSRQIERTYHAQALVMENNKALCDRACARRRDAPRRCENRRRHVLYREWGHDRLEAGDRRGAREQLRRALAYSPSDAWTWRLFLLTFAKERWRARVRTLFGRRAPAAHDPVTPPSVHHGGARPVSLVHDTAYRRLRHSVIGSVHSADEAIWRRLHPQRRVLFEAASPMSVTIFRPVIERLKKDPRVELWFTCYSTVWDPHQLFGAHGIAENIVTRGRAAWLKVNAYVNADFWDMTWLHRRTRRVHLFHGVAGKYNLDAPVDLAPTIAAFDCLMFVNADRRRRYIDAGLVAEDLLRAPLVGYPKLDCLVDGSLDPAAIRTRLGLDAAIPTVIYAPTWSPHSSLNAMGMEIIERLAAEGLQVIVKLHDRSYDRRERGSGGIDWARRLAEYDEHPLVRIARESDGSSFMAVSDAMVSDHSSIAFEYMVLDRPLVVIDSPRLIANARISADKVNRLHAAARVVVTAEEVAAAVRDGLVQPSRLSAERRHVAGDLFHAPGTATDRALAHLYRLLELPAPGILHSTVTTDRQLAGVG